MLLHYQWCIPYVGAVLTLVPELELHVERNFVCPYCGDPVPEWPCDVDRRAHCDPTPSVGLKHVIWLEAFRSKQNEAPC